MAPASDIAGVYMYSLHACRDSTVIGIEYNEEERVRKEPFHGPGAVLIEAQDWSHIYRK